MYIKFIFQAFGNTFIKYNLPGPISVYFPTLPATPSGANAQKPAMDQKRVACCSAADTYSSKMGNYSIQQHTSHSCLRGNWACSDSGLSPAHSPLRAQGHSCKLREIPVVKGSVFHPLNAANTSQDFSGSVSYLIIALQLFLKEHSLFLTSYLIHGSH